MAKRQAEEKARLEAKVARGGVEASSSWSSSSSSSVASFAARGTTQPKPFNLSGCRGGTGAGEGGDGGGASPSPARLLPRHSKARIEAEAAARHAAECTFRPTTNESGSKEVVQQLLLNDDDDDDDDDDEHDDGEGDDDDEVKGGERGYEVEGNEGVEEGRDGYDDDEFEVDVDYEGGEGYEEGYENEGTRRYAQGGNTGHITGGGGGTGVAAAFGDGQSDCAYPGSSGLDGEKQGYDNDDENSHVFWSSQGHGGNGGRY
jgi:hypothetical protein